MHIVQSTLAVVLVLGGLIFFHELGHFLVARMLGIGVKAFSLGFGPRLAGFRRNKTEYKVSLVPLGGYVSLVGESAGEPLPAGFTQGESFTARPAFQRMLVVAAGPIFNFVLAILIYWGLFWSHGQFALAPEVGDVRDDSPAMQAGIRKGDTLLKVDGKTVTYWEDIVELVRGAGERSVSIELSRDGSELTFEMTPRVTVTKSIFGEEERVPMIGIAASGKTIAIPLDGGSAALAAVKQTGTVIVLTVEGIIKMIERVIPADTIGGPIMIAQMVGQQAEEGLANVLALAAFISINLGFLNLLPIPVLDGGHILFLVIEGITGKPLSERWQAITIRIGLALLLGLMSFAIINDIKRIITTP